MRRVRLYFLDNDRQSFIDSSGGRLPLVYLRLSVMVRISSQNLIRDGLIDTGTAISVFPTALWRQFEDEIEWLHPAAGQPLPTWWTSASGLTGGMFPCRIGRISLTLFDKSRNEIRGIPVIGKFVEDDGKLRERILFGLGHGILQGRRLHLDPDRREAWLEDRA